MRPRNLRVLAKYQGKDERGEEERQRVAQTATLHIPGDYSWFQPNTGHWVDMLVLKK